VPITVSSLYLGPRPFFTFS